MQRVRLHLKSDYEWPAKNPDQPNKNKIGFVCTDQIIELGQIISFEDLNPMSGPGDLNTDHYKYFSGRRYQSVPPPYPTIKVELIEI